MINQVAQAIYDSVHENRIVTIDDVTTEDICYLVARSDDWEKSNSGIYEVWGTDDDGNEWRVHAVDPNYDGPREPDYGAPSAQERAEREYDKKRETR